MLKKALSELKLFTASQISRSDIESAPAFNFNPLQGIYETVDLTCQ